MVCNIHFVNHRIILSAKNEFDFIVSTGLQVFLVNSGCYTCNSE